MENNMEYYIVVFVYHKEKYYFIWMTDEEDKFLIENNKILFCKSLKKIEIYAKKHKIKFAQTEKIIYNIDICEQWCLSLENNVDCNVIINFWNIFLDLCNSIHMRFLGSDSRFDEIYEKLFCGNNLPAVKITSKKYIPIFLEDEIKQIKKVLKSGINAFLKIVCQGDGSIDDILWRK